MIAANTRQAAEYCRGRTIKGVVFDADRSGMMAMLDDEGTYITFIFDDGSGFTFAPSSGAYWAENAHAIQRLLAQTKQKLETTSKDLKAVLELAGQLDEEG